MKISHFFEFESTVTGGMKQSVKNQRKALDKRNIEYTEKPDLSADILHLNLMGPRSIYYAYKAQKRDVPVVIHTHVTAEDFGQSFRFTNTLSKPLKPYLRRAYSLADKIICPSNHNQNVIRDYVEKDSTVITNGFDKEKLEGYEDLREDYLEKFDLTPPVVFNVGHVIKRKGLKTFIETAERMPDTDFIWFGPLDLKLKGRETQKLIKNSPENCKFSGYIDDIRGGFAAGDIFFFPTHEENEGIALLEAMYTGKPLVVRDIETFEWLEDGDNCLKAEKDFKPLIEKLEDTNVREEMGKRSKEISKDYTLEKVGKRLEEEYKDLMALEHG